VGGKKPRLKAEAFCFYNKDPVSYQITKELLLSLATADKNHWY